MTKDTPIQGLRQYTYALVCIVLLSGAQGCVSQTQYMPWLQQSKTELPVKNAEQLPSLTDFRGGEAPKRRDVKVPPYPDSFLFRVETFDTPTIGQFREICPNRRGLILVTKHETDKVIRWYKSNLLNSRILDVHQEFVPIVWGRFARYEWPREEVRDIVMRAPYVGISQIKGTALETVVPSFSTAIDVLYCVS